MIHEAVRCVGVIVCSVLAATTLRACWEVLRHGVEMIEMERWRRSTRQ